MRAWWAVFGGALALLAPLAAFGGNDTTVSQALIGRDGERITRLSLRFSAPVVPLGRAAPPIVMDCPVPGNGHWADPTTFVWEFARPLPAGLSCAAKLVDDLKDAAGGAISGTRRFPVDSGGPAVLAVLPRENGAIEEDQSFIVAVSGPIDRASVAAGAYCAVEGLGERIPIDLMPADTVARVLPVASSEWERREFLDAGGIPNPLPTNPKARAAALTSTIALKCHRPLPPGRHVSIVWGKMIRTPGGPAVGSDRRLDFSVREAFSAKMSCERANAAAGCDPILPITVSFTAPVARAAALGLQLDLGGGKSAIPTADGSSATVREITFKPAFPAAITARLTMPAGLKDESGRPLANARRFPLDVEIAEAPPLVKFAAPFGLIEAREGGMLPVTVRGVEPRLGQAIKAIGGGMARIDADDAAIADWMRRVAKSQESDFRIEKKGGQDVTVNHTGDRPLLAAKDASRHLQLALPGGGRPFEVVGIPLEKPGFYVVELASPLLGRALLGRPATRYVASAALVTNMAVHFKWGHGTSLAWVTSLDSGAPVAGAAVRVTDSCSGKLLASAATDSSGRLQIRNLPAPSTSSDCARETGESSPLMISARKDGDLSFVLTSWGEGIRPYDFDLPYGWSAPQPIFHTIFDRTLLRGGETLHMTHVYRQPGVFGFRSGGTAKGVLTLRHRGSDMSFDLPLALGREGRGESEWTPPKAAPTGDYDLVFKTGKDEIATGQSVRVDEYRLPTMRASVRGPKLAAVRPKRLPVDLYVGYLSGGGAPHMPIRLRTAWTAMAMKPAGWEDWTFGGAPVRPGTVPLDENQNDLKAASLPASATLPATLDAHGALRTNIDMPILPDEARLTVEMDYQDANGQTLTASTNLPVYPAAVRVAIRPDGWMQRAGAMRLKLAALTPEGTPISGKHISVALYTREIVSARRRLIGGFYAYDNSAVTRRIAARCEATTDIRGMADCAIDPGVSGEVIAVATARDVQGNESRAVTSLWLVGDDEWWFGGDNGDRMDVIPDAKSYPAGGIAHVQVRMPFRSATALVSVEREGVLSSFVTTISGKDPVIDVKLPGAYAPDAYISVLAVRGRIAGWRLWLADFARRWHLPFFSQDGGYPTALVDLAKPSYRLGIAKVAVGWETHQLKVTVRAERNRYRIRDHARVAVQVTGPGGKPPASAEIAFAAVDEALLQLSPNDSWDILSAMMGERPLSVLTSTAQMQVVGKRHYGRKAVASGGGGGGDLSSLTRSDFRPVLLWRGRVRLDAQGRAMVDVPLADALSSYKLVAVATAGEQLFGTGSSAIRTVQDLTIYPGMPPLVRSGDFYHATFTLRNGTDRPLTVTANVALTPTVARGAALTVAIPPGGARPVTWRLTAPEHLNRLHWTVTARSADGRAKDAVAVDQQIVPVVPVTTWAASLLRIDGDTRFPVAAPIGALPGQGGVDVTLMASSVAPLAGVRAYMTAYPYGCFEQRLSKAVALGDRAAWAKQIGELPTYVAGNGLLRYWPEERQPGSIALTAYALSLTADAGLPWPDDVKARLLETLKGVVERRITETYASPGDARFLRMAALAALARNGAATLDMLPRVAMPLGEMPTEALADWIVTLDHVPGADPRQRAAAEQALRGRIIYEGTRLDLTDGKTAPWWMMVSDDEMAIKALLAVTGKPGWQNETPRMMVGLALRQMHGHWDTTPANAWGTVAAARFAVAYPPAAIGGATTARIGAQAATSIALRPAIVSLKLPPAPTPLLLTHSATPGPWASVAVRAAVPLRAADFAGYRVSREVSFVQRQRAGQISRGDVLKIRITVEAPVDRTWVVVEDPIPAGASIIGAGGGQSALLAAQEDGEGAGSGPSYVEQGLDAWRSYFGWLAKGKTTVEYTARMNTPGRFRLPPTHVEAMYSPEIHASLPNAPVVIVP